MTTTPIPSGKKQNAYPSLRLVERRKRAQSVWGRKKNGNKYYSLAVGLRNLAAATTPVWAAFRPDFISSLYLGLCSNMTSSEKPSLTSPEIESQKPSHSLILILLYFFFLALLSP